jgi:hypothetical protein
MTNNTLINMVKHASSRWKQPTPSWFKFIIKTGIMLTAIGTAVISSPVPLPAPVTSVAGYFVVVGIVISVVAKTAVEPE